MRKLAIGFGLFLILVEIAFVSISGGPEFWAMWVKNIVVGSLLIAAATFTKNADDSIVGKYLAAAWGFACGLFAMSTLALIDGGRPLLLIMGLGTYSLVSLIGLRGTLRQSAEP